VHQPRGGALGVGIAYSGLGLLRSLATRVTPRASEITIDPVVLAFAFIASIIVGLVAAFVPVMRRTGSLSDALRAGATTATGTRHDGRARSMLVGAQVGIAFVLLVGAGLMVRSLLKLQRVDGGYATTNVLSARIDLDWTRYNNPAVQTDQSPAVRAFVDGLTNRLRPQTGVLSVAVASNFPLNNATPGTQTFQIRGQDVAPDRLPKTDVTIVSADYFKTMGIPVLRGSVFSDAARDTATRSIVISQRLAKTNWPNQEAIGQQISINGGRTWLTIAGVVGDVRQKWIVPGHHRRGVPAVHDLLDDGHQSSRTNVGRPKPARQSHSRRRARDRRETAGRFDSNDGGVARNATVGAARDHRTARVICRPRARDHGGRTRGRDCLRRQSAPE
jgi:hypothetical protein